MKSSGFVFFCIFVAWCDGGLYSINGLYSMVTINSISLWAPSD